MPDAAAGSGLEGDTMRGFWGRLRQCGVVLSTLLLVGGCATQSDYPELPTVDVVQIVHEPDVIELTP